MTLHREGKGWVMGTLIFFIVVNSLLLTTLSTPDWFKVSVFLLTFIFFIMVLQFFRYPRRSITRNDNYVISPCDGKVVVIEKTEEPEFYKDKRIQVSIFMSPVNVHANWYPMSGVVRYAKYHAGKYLVAWHPKASTDNERTTIVLEKDSRRTVLLRQVAGALARRIVYYPRENDKVIQGGELGFIKFGSRVDLYLPLDATINVAIGQKTVGGVTVIAEYAKG